MRRLRIAFAVVAGWSICAAAQATQYSYIVTGTVDLSGYSANPQKIFGPGVANGDVFTATFLVDDGNTNASFDYSGVEVGGPGVSIIAPGSIAQGASGCQNNSGPSCTPTPPTFLSASVTVGGTTFAIPATPPNTPSAPGSDFTNRSTGGTVTKFYTGQHTGFFQDDLLTIDAELDRADSNSTTGTGSTRFYEINFQAYSTLFTSTDFREALSIDLPAATSDFNPPRSAIYITADDTAYTNGVGVDDDAFVILSATHLTVSASPVPDVATWLSGVLGFAVIGALARRDRTRVPA